jgi:thiol-disulfide isomerase/thioredoxin
VRRVVLALLLIACVGAGALAWSAMSDDGIVVRPPDVEVDTPALRAVKAQIGMEDCTPGTGPAVTGGLPEVTLPCLGGGPDVELSSLRGPMVINLWQAGCVPCEKEMPVLQEFHETYADQVAIVGVDFNDVHPASALDLARSTGATYPSIADPGGDLMTEDAFAIGRRGLPAFVFVDADGTVVGQDSGGVDSLAQHLGITL